MLAIKSFQELRSHTLYNLGGKVMLL